MELYRITQRKWANALYPSGHPALWNSAQTEVIYTAASRSLACLENIVHRKSAELTELYAVMVIYIPDDAPVFQLSAAQLPPLWYKAGEAGYNLCRRYGDAWAAERQHLLLKVPSAIIRNEYNYIINPHHAEFKKVRLVEAESFYFDDRVVR